MRAGGTVSLAGIHMSDVPAMPYDLLWHERSLRSVANMTRADAQEFMDLAAVAGIRAAYEVFPLEAANERCARDQGRRGPRRRGPPGDADGQALTSKLHE